MIHIWHVVLKFFGCHQPNKAFSIYCGSKQNNFAPKAGNDFKGNWYNLFLDFSNLQVHGFALFFQNGSTPPYQQSPIKYNSFPYLRFMYNYLP